MIEVFKDALLGQYDAALAMLEDCMAKCPDDKWEGYVGNFPFWHVAYHALFYVDLYLSPNHESFEPPEFYRENYQYFGHLPESNERFVADIPYDKQTMLDYVQHCRRKAAQSVAVETWESLHGECGFGWYDLPRSEFHLNNIRHAQHHAAQMSLYLRRSSNIDVRWVGRRDHTT